MSMLYRGACPSCAAAVSLRAPLGSEGTCAACGRRYLVLVPELDDPAAGGRAEAEVQLLPVAAERSPALQRPLRQVGRLVLFGAAGVTLVLAVWVVLLLALPEESSFGRWFTLQLVLRFPLVALIGAAVLWILLGAEVRAKPSFDIARSALALTVGFLATLPVPWLLAPVWRTEHEPILEQGLGVLIIVLEGLLAGWWTARLAPLGPYKHALALGIAIALATLALAAPAGLTVVMVTALVWGIFVPAVLAGAWLHARLRRPPLASSAS